jgi:hypothetical protein
MRKLLLIMGLVFGLVTTFLNIMVLTNKPDKKTITASHYVNLILSSIVLITCTVFLCRDMRNASSKNPLFSFG